jgi:hypothetical protein
LVYEKEGIAVQSKESSTIELSKIGVDRVNAASLNARLLADPTIPGPSPKAI